MKRSLLGAWILLAACAPPAVPAQADPRAEVGRIREAVRQLLTAPSPENRDLEWLFSPAAIDTVRRGMQVEKGADGRRALRHLHGFLVAETLRRAAGELDSPIRDAAVRPFQLGGRTLTLAELSDTVAGEADPNARRRMAEAVAPVLAELNPLLEQQDERITATARRLGYSDRVRLATAARGHNVRAAGELAKRLLSSSDALYLSALGELAPPTLRVPLANLRRPDMPRLGRLCAADVAADAEAGAVNATVLTLGLDLPRSRLACDELDPRLAWQRRVNCRGALHAVGHALHEVYTRTPAFELRRLGDQSVAEGFAFLFERLGRDRRWLVEQLHLPDDPSLADHLRLAALCDLVEARTLAAEVLFELEWRSSSEADPRATYAKNLRRALGFPLEPIDVEQFRVARGPFIEAADGLRARVLAAQIDADLRRRFGERWWRSTDAGLRLREAWAAGQRDTAEEVARHLELGDLDPQPLLAAAARALRGPVAAPR